MCWTSEFYDKEEVDNGADALGITKIAEEDITVYKVGFLGKEEQESKTVHIFLPYFNLYYYCYYYNINEKQQEIELDFIPEQQDYNWYFEVNRGYHSFYGSADCWQDIMGVYVDNVLKRFQEYCNSPLVIGEFIIPKGSIYAIGQDNEVVSSNILWNGRFIIAENLPSVHLSFKEIFGKNENINDCNK